MMTKTTRLTEDEVRTLRIVVIAVSSLSLIGCIYILWHQWRRFCAQEKFSTTRRMVTVLAVLDILYMVPKPLGRVTIGHPRACNLQGAAIISFGTMLFIWMSFMAHNLYRWIVCRDSPEKMEKRFKWYLVLCIVPSLALGLAFVSADLIGDATFYCWVANTKYYPVALFIWILAALTYICVVLTLTQSHLARRARSHGNAEAMESLSMVCFKLRVYIVTFVVLWMPCLLFRAVEMLGVKHTFALALIMQVSLALQGLANAVIYGGLLTAMRKAIHRRQPNPECSKPLASPMVYRSLTETNASQKDKTSLFVDPANVFVSTFNMGEAKVKSCSLNDWIPRGFDIYVIGVQECLQLGELRSKILDHIQTNDHVDSSGNSTKEVVKYNQFSREIGNCATALGYHGHIALTVYVKAEDVNNGAFFMPTHAQQEVNRGKSLVLGRASNKGAVGFAFRYYDTSLAFVACHLTSDSKGKSKASRRNQDLAAILEQLHLNVDDVGLEFPLIHHHTFLLGDLNYRLALGNRLQSPLQVLQLLTEVREEQVHLQDSRFSPSSSPCLLQRVQRGSRSSDRSGSLGVLSLASLSSENTTGGSNSNQIGPDSQMAREKQRIWSKLLVHDELTYYLRSGQVLYGFEEPEISFPPTFRRIRGTHLPSDAASSWNLEQVTQCFSTEVEGAGQRVPSYTDRILFRSLSDCRDRLRCVSYSSCEQVDVSDHKPVNGVFELVVDRCCKPLELYRQSVAYVQRVKDLAGVYDCCICLQYSSLVWSSGTGEHLSAHTELWGTTQFVCSDSKSIDAKQVSVSVVFPLPSEDIFSEQRKLHEVADVVRNGMFAGNSHTEQSLRSSTASASWTEFIRKGIRHTSLTCPSSSRHLAIKVQTLSGNSLGQGIVGFCHEIAGPQFFEIGLSVGGKRAGILSGVVSIALTRPRHQNRSVERSV